MADTFASFGRRVDRFEKELGDDAMGHALGKMAKSEAMSAASADLGGDPRFSGWAPELDTSYDIIGPGRISFHPKKRSAGPWTVAEFGRNQAEGPRQVGPRLTKTGRVSRARVKRYNGRTKGKATASDALDAIDKKAPGVVDRQTKAAIRKFFA